MTNRQENVLIFKDTERMCRNNAKLVVAIRNSRQKQQIFLEKDIIEKGNNKSDKPIEIVVSKKRSLEAAMNYEGQKICVLNFASATNPGGGVTRGSSAQEECLCRCSTLYANLNIDKFMKGFYIPHRKAKNYLYNDDCIYTPDVTVFKTDSAHPEIMKEEDWYHVNVITCAAPNLRVHAGDYKENTMLNRKGIKELHLKRGRRILDIAKTNGNEVIILGAFGCGAFRNPPEIVAEAYSELLEEYKYDFKIVEFAVYCSPRDEINYQIFKKILERRN